jgi:hypothetical protein
MNVGFTAYDRPRRFYGAGRIAGDLPSGLVTVAAVPAKREVMLFTARCRKLVATTLSAADGRYSFDYLDASRRYVLVAFDHELQFNAVIRDNIAPVTE